MIVNRRRASGGRFVTADASRYSAKKAVAAGGSAQWHFVESRLPRRW
jgi:hypothetical protein